MPYFEPVLVVDDDPLFCTIAAEAMKSRGVTSVYTARDGAEGLEMLARADLDIGLIVLDLNMPKLDGLAFMRELPKLGFTGQILISSGEDGSILKSSLNLGKMLNVNVVGALKKPIDPAQLDAALERCAEVSKAVKVNAISTQASGEDEVTLVPFYQPQFYLKDHSLAGAEALSRIKLPDGGFAPPNGYFERISHTPRAKNAAIASTRAIFQDMSEWQFLGFECDIAINLDASVVEAAGVAEMICELADEFSLSPDSIAIELTETALPKEMSRLLESLTRLRLAGFHLALDDYGTGGANFELLQLCPFTHLKIDMSIIQSMEFDPVARHFFETTIELARNLDLETIAEGIETEAQLEITRRQGVHIGQGYLLGRPEPEIQFRSHLAGHDAGGADFAQNG